MRHGLKAHVTLGFEMSYMYGILAVMGWAWTGTVIALAAIWLPPVVQARGFAVVENHEKQP